ncbi:MAG TPA: DNA translocase FtsK [Solirubrobacteraceae bacterium]|nr:DNA translocase FtsK [Solirubrobacteraceae bacterium]
MLRTTLRAPVLAPHHVDVAALALVAVGVFLGGVAYLHWAGGPLGRGLLDGARLAVGKLAYALAPALAAAGALLLARELRPPMRPMRTGATCLVAALTLAFAAGTLGLGPGAAPAADAWRPHWLMARGGALGEAELWCAEHLLSRAGADILAVFLALAGVMLTTGATLAGIVRATGAGVEATSRVVRRSQGTLAGTLGRAGRGERPDPAQRLSPADRFAQAQAVAVLDAPDGPQGPGGEGPVDAGGEGDGVPGGDGAGALGGQTGDGALDGRTGGGTLDLDAASDASAAGGEGEGEGPDTVRMVVRSTHVEAPANGELGAVAPAQAARAQLTPRGRYRASVTDDPDFQWRLPDARLLTRSGAEASRPDTAGQEQVAATLLETLGHFGIQARVIGRVTGPHITRYELRLAPGIKVAKVAQLKDDLAYALAATDIRILAPIPGKQAVGVEVPNANRRIVHLGDVFQDPPPDWSPLAVWLGKDIAGRAIGADLARMPHLLVAGTTGAGKSACVNAMLSSILLRATPHQVRIVLVDPKQVELNHYEGVPHLLTPVITSPRMAATALQNLVREMEQRYSIMSLARTRSLPELNRVRERRGEPPLPYILCVIDELADLMMVAPADVEDSIIRLAQKARAVGIHLVLATQSPRVDVITGMIKANVPSRIAFAVSSQTDSRVILDQNGAESLLGQGDMLFSPVGSSKLQRIQGAYIDEQQILELTECWRRQGEPEFQEQLLEEVADPDGQDGSDEESLSADEDPLLEEAIWLVASMGTASTSMLQRRLRLGYTRAGRLIDMLERRGIISGYEGSKPRQVLVSEADVPRILQHLAQGERTDDRRPAQDGPDDDQRPAQGERAAELATEPGQPQPTAAPAGPPAPSAQD